MRGDGTVGDDNDMSVSLILRKQHSALRQKQKNMLKYYVGLMRQQPTKTKSRICLNPLALIIGSLK